MIDVPLISVLFKENSIVLLLHRLLVKYSHTGKGSYGHNGPTCIVLSILILDDKSLAIGYCTLLRTFS